MSFLEGQKAEALHADGRTNRRTDKPSYRVASPRLKMTPSSSLSLVFVVGELSGGEVGDAVVETPLGQFVVRHEKLAHLRHRFRRLLNAHVFHGRRRRHDGGRERRFEAPLSSKPHPIFLTSINNLQNNNEN